ncbi:MAG: hypothetical protein LBJ37_27745 [Paucimonas sp.]|jgi:hypothetical protein|nr:hypothetical protein [Paucimonas sp.]
MRLHSLLALAAAGALLMPLAAHAGKFPAGKDGTYMDQCIQTATGKGLDVNTANKHCKCGKEAIEKNFSDKEIAALDSTTGVDANLMQRAQTAVQNACAPKK